MTHTVRRNPPLQGAAFAREMTTNMPIPSTKWRDDDSIAAAVPIGPQRAPRGTLRTCQTWAAEAALRMLMNNL
ncbi:MAG: hypothetical protein ABI054_06625, partial [Planctomycetota bacterium]